MTLEKQLLQIVSLAFVQIVNINSKWAQKPKFNKMYIIWEKTFYDVENKTRTKKNGQHIYNFCAFAFAFE